MTSLRRELEELDPPSSVLTALSARSIARDAYIYGFPLVDSYRIQHAYFVDKTSSEYKGSWNAIHSMARVYTPEDKVVQTPNSDTPCSVLGADLRADPLVLTVPEVEPGRYYSIQFIDMYTFNFAYAGTRSTGNGAGHILLAGPNWRGQGPPGMKKVVRSETELAFLIYRTQLFNPTDVENVKRIQSGYRVQTLSQYLDRPVLAAVPIDFVAPLNAREERSSLSFFEILDFLLQLCPTNPSELDLMARFAAFDIGAGKSFDPKTLDPESRQAMLGGIGDAWSECKRVESKRSNGALGSGDLFGTRAHLRNNYSYRMAAAALGIYGHSQEEALYCAYSADASGGPLDGARSYTLRFAPDHLPPVNAFWSLTMYEQPSQLLVTNPINRYLINSAMLQSLKRDSDGGLTLLIQQKTPLKDQEPNWLPAPSGSFALSLRLYWPKTDAFNGRWKPPLIRRA